MRLGKILGLSELDYDAQLIHSIPKSYRAIMFHDNGGFQYSKGPSINDVSARRGVDQKNM